MRGRQVEGYFLIGTLVCPFFVASFVSILACLEVKKANWEAEEANRERESMVETITEAEQPRGQTLGG